MSNQTKIIVIRQKNLIIGAFAALAVILLILFIVMKPGTPASNPPSDVLPQYTAGVYSSTILVNGNPIEIRVTMDKNLIHDIDTANVSDSIETVFPLFDSCFSEIATQVINNNSTDNITYSAGNEYTSTVLLEAIETAISKSR